MSVFDSNPELDIIFGYVKQFISSELDETVKQNISIPHELMKGYFKGTMLIKKDSLYRVGLFDTGWQVGEFIDWYIKSVEKELKSFMMSEILLKRRVHNTNMGIREKKSQNDYVRILKASLDRRRGTTKTNLS